MLETIHWSYFLRQIEETFLRPPHYAKSLKGICSRGQQTNFNSRLTIEKTSTIEGRTAYTISRIKSELGGSRGHWNVVFVQKGFCNLMNGLEKDSSAYNRQTVILLSNAINMGFMMHFQAQKPDERVGWI